MIYDVAPGDIIFSHDHYTLCEGHEGKIYLPATVLHVDAETLLVTSGGQQFTVSRYLTFQKERTPHE